MPDEADMPTHVPLDAGGRVAEDLACIQCGYNLRTLHREAKCPECGMAVGRSLLGNCLQYCDPKWLTKLAREVELIFWMIAVPFLVLVLMMIAVAIAQALGAEGGPTLFAVLGLLNSLLFFGVCIGLVIGVWQFTTPAPNRLGPTSDLDVRRFIRVCVCMLLVSIPAGMIFQRGVVVRAVELLTSLLSFLCGNVALLLYIRRLALRIPNRKEAGIARALIVGFVVGIVFTVLGAMAGPTAAGPGCTIAVGGCIDTVLLLAFTLQLDRFRKILDDIAHKAQERQARAIQPAGCASLDPESPL
jgi:hypothetical protein